MPEKGIQSFMLIGLFWALTVAVAYLITRFTDGPRAALRRVLITGPVFAAILALAILLSVGRTREFALSGWFWVFLESVLLIAAVGHVVSWPSRRRRAGEPLLVFARSRTQKSHMVLGGILAIAAVAQIVEPLLGAPNIPAVVLALLVLAVGVEFLCAGLIPAGASKRGLLDFWRFVEWPFIASYHWRDGRDGVDSTLIMTLRNRRFYLNDLRPLFFRRVEWKVRQEQKETVDALVREFVPAANAGPEPSVRP